MKSYLVLNGILMSMIGTSIYANKLAPVDAVSLNVNKESENKFKWVRTSDLVKYYPSLTKGLNKFEEDLIKNPEILNLENKANIKNITIIDSPKTSNNKNYYSLIVFYELKDGTNLFSFVDLEIGSNAKGKPEYRSEILKTINLKDTEFVVETSLVDRKVIIKDDKNNLKFVFPIGVGSFDEGVLNEGKTSLLTPRFTNGNIPKSSIISKREMPRYFKGKPFIRIHDGDKRTEIGFHIEINDYFNRGFDSHGCIRLRESDLQNFHDMLMGNSRATTPVTLKYYVQDDSDHPAKLNNSYYKTVTNKGTKEEPFFILDRDGLVQVNYKEGLPPFSDLFDDNSDNYYELFNYNTQEQLAEQNARRRAECVEELQPLVGNKNYNKAFEECMNEGKRKSTVGDWFYRKWVHGN